MIVVKGLSWVVTISRQKVRRAVGEPFDCEINYCNYYQLNFDAKDQFHEPWGGFMETGYGRVRDLAGLPELIEELEGSRGLERVFADQEVPLSICHTPDAPISIRDLIGLYKRAGEICGVRSIGLVACDGINVAQHGLGGAYSCQGTDLLNGCHRFRAALPFHESGSSFGWAADGNELALFYKNMHHEVNGFRHGGDFTLRIIEDTITNYLGTCWKPIRVEVCYSENRALEDLEAHFGAPVHLVEDRIAIVIDREELNRDQCSVSYDGSYFVTKSDLFDYGQVLPKNFHQVVESVAKQNMVGKMPTIEDVASGLNIGTRTMQRRLEEFGTNYRELLLRLRMKRAMELLLESGLSLAQISEQLGYSYLPQFMRAFKNYYGCTPGEFRKRPLNG